MVDDLLSTRIRYATRTTLESYPKEFKKKAQEERKLYIDVVEKSVKDIIKDEVKSILPHIIPKEVSDFATPMIQSTITESLENVVLSKSSSQPSREDKDKDEDPPAGPDQWLKKKKKSKDVEPSRGSKSKKSKSSSSKGSKSQPKSSGKSAQEEDQYILVGPAFNLLKGTCKSFVELEYHFEECYKAVTDQLDWNNPEGHEYPFDLSKPLPLIKAQGRQVVPADYFFNNALEYLKDGSSSKNYTTSITKTKAARYDNIKSIEDMVPELWSPVKHDVFSRKRIIAVTHVKVMKWYGYGYLEEIIVRREDQSLHKFKEGDFPRLNLRDIEDLLLLLVQKKLSNLEQDVIFDLNVALRISGISKLTPYTVYKNPQGIIYQDRFKRNRLIRFDELYKFYDGTLTSIRRVLHDIANNLRMDYLPKRRWSNLD
ncbi:hypothetical protein Tco_0563833 [Tanacetum coccineum]